MCTNVSSVFTGAIWFHAARSSAGLEAAWPLGISLGTPCRVLGGFCRVSGYANIYIYMHIHVFLYIFVFNCFFFVYKPCRTHKKPNGVCPGKTQQGAAERERETQRDARTHEHADATQPRTDTRREAGGQATTEKQDTHTHKQANKEATYYQQNELLHEQPPTHTDQRACTNKHNQIARQYKR